MTRTTLHLVAALLVCGLSPLSTIIPARTALSSYAARSPLFAQERPEPTPPRRVTGIPATVPLIMLGREPAALPVVEVLLDGKGPFRFGIETGANFLVMRPALADSLKLARAANAAQSVLVGTMQIGGARFEGVRFETLATASRDIDGVLGLPLYSGLLLTVDYPGKLVRFESGALPAPNGKDILPIKRAGDFWSLPVSIAGRPYQGVIDTRSTGAFGVVPSVSTKLSFDGEPIVIGMARGAAIQETEVKLGRLAGDVVIGQYRFPKPDVGIRSLPPGFPEEPLIGTIVLQHFTMTLDQRNARVRLSHAGDNRILLPSRPGAPSGAPAAGRPASAPIAAVPLDVKSAAALVGVYGERTVTLEHDTLYLQRAGGPRLVLVPVGKDAFTLREAPTARIEFQRVATGRAVRLRVLNREGVWETSERTR